MSETWDEQRSRLEMMAEGNPKWDLSKNDRLAIDSALRKIEMLEAFKATIESKLIEQ